MNGDLDPRTIGEIEEALSAVRPPETRRWPPPCPLDGFVRIGTTQNGKMTPVFRHVDFPDHCRFCEHGPMRFAVPVTATALWSCPSFICGTYVEERL